MSIEELEHTADVRLRITAKSYEELFSLAAEALSMILYPGERRAVSTKECEVSGDDREELLREFLSELLFISEVDSFVISETAICFTDGSLHATIRGEPFDRSRHGGGREVKGISYSDLLILEIGEEISCEIIFDI